MSGLYNMLTLQIVMYAAQYCSGCHRSKAFFEANKIGYLNVNLEGNEEAMQFVMTLNRGFAHLNKKGRADSLLNPNLPGV